MLVGKIPLVGGENFNVLQPTSFGCMSSLCTYFMKPHLVSTSSGENSNVHDQIVLPVGRTHEIL